MFHQIWLFDCFIRSGKLWPWFTHLAVEGKGGSLYFGIGSTIHGVTLTRDDRDEFRLGVDRMMRDKIAPCALHSMFDVLYTPIKEKDQVSDTLTPIKDRFVAGQYMSLVCMAVFVRANIPTTGYSGINRINNSCAVCVSCLCWEFSCWW